MTEYYYNPDDFDPDRFSPEHGGVKAFKERCVLIPFGDGPRICSGMKFAQTEVKAAIAEVVRNFKISIDEITPRYLKVSPNEFMNLPDQKVLLHFQQI